MVAFSSCVSTLSIAGIANAMVLPVPVCERAITSTPVLMSGMASDWMGVARSKPISTMALSTLGVRLSCENGILVMEFLNSKLSKKTRHNASFGTDVSTNIITMYHEHYVLSNIRSSCPS